jgi:Tfp pilus assembly protein PilN
MIEINLLPPEYRPREKTNVPLILTVACGMVLVGGIILYGIGLKRELGSLTTQHTELMKEKAALEDDVKKVKALRAKIARQKARQQTIIEISQSKVMWSLKLQQLSQILEQFPNFWVKRLALATSSRGGSIKMSVNATGSNLREIARFRDSLKDDPNFSYHFEGVQSPGVKIGTLPKGMNFSEYMDISLTLPLKKPATAKKRRR